MDLTGRLDPEVAAVFPHLPVLDLTDIPAAERSEGGQLGGGWSSAASGERYRRKD